MELFHKNIRAKSPRFPQELLVRIWWKFPGTTRISFPSTQPLSVTPWMIASCSHTPHRQSLTINRSAHNKQRWLTSDRRVKTEQGSTGFFFFFFSQFISCHRCEIVCSRSADPFLLSAGLESYRTGIIWLFCHPVSTESCWERRHRMGWVSVPKHTSANTGHPRVTSEPYQNTSSDDSLRHVDEV